MKIHLLIPLVLILGCATDSKPTAENTGKSENKAEEILDRDGMVRKSIERKLQKEMHDPKSYEFVSLLCLDSITYRKNLEYILKDCAQSIEEDQRMHKSNSSFNRSYPGSYSKEDLEKLQLKIEKEKVLLEKCKTIGDSLGNKLNEVASYLYVFEMRGNNKMGGKVLQEYYVQTSNEHPYVIYNMATEVSELILAPGTLPGLNPYTIYADM